MFRKVRDIRALFFVGMLGGKGRDAGWKFRDRAADAWVEIIDAGWKQNIASKYCETLSVN